ncbi:MAG: ABC transporter ATP-binding protein [Proteobacteria bacterium]|nr:MAG: ABC transporter ATP-binding protein [Pseudomonadota bacterium]
MLERIQDRLALSETGARAFVKGVVFTTLLNVGLMLPAVYMFVFLDDHLVGVLDPLRAPTHGPVYYVLLALGFMALTWVLARLQYRATYVSVYEESASRRVAVAEKLRKLPLAFFGAKDLADLTSTIMADNRDLEHTFSHAVPQLFASIASIGLVAIGMFVYQWQLALALFWVVPVAGLVMWLSRTWLRRGNAELYADKRAVSDRIQEGMETIQELKAYRLEARYLADLDRDLDTYERDLIRTELTGGVLLNGTHGLLKLGLVSVILVGAHLMAAGQVSLFTYLIFLLVASRVFEPVGEVFNNLAALLYLDVRIARMRELQKMPVQRGDSDLSPASFDLAFEDVRFAYEADKTVLDGVSFTAKQGEITALVGPSGGGKSTSAMLAARFWDVDGGRVSLGGRDIREIDPEALLEHISVVFQEVILFNASVMDNIRVGRRDASDDEVRRVAALARCDDFVARLPEGYDTVIGENGETLSGGERQRISIARALLKDAPIVLLDEATASLDVENETRIQAALSELVRGKTVLIIAHRMRTVAHADKIVVLADGVVVEQGSPAELIAGDGLFAAMMARQLTQ